MYIYVYDNFLSEKKYANFLAKTESRLHDLGVQGKICQLHILKNIRSVIEDTMRGSNGTLVAVGNDQTFNKMVNVAAELGLVLGFIPATSKCQTSQLLGMSNSELACEIIAQRLIKDIDLAYINDYAFISSAQVVGGSPILDFGDYTVKPTQENVQIFLCNLSSFPDVDNNPTDGILEAVLRPENNSLKAWFKKKAAPKSSVIPFQKLKIKNEGEPCAVSVDDHIVFKTPVEISVKPKSLKVIVGTSRSF
jgi:diacylglycerol kinase family enzyme